MDELEFYQTVTQQQHIEYERTLELLTIRRDAYEPDSWQWYQQQLRIEQLQKNISI